ncbi:MAG: YdeI/OmpD-associated family protein [Bacteroidia bacterium]
MKATFFKTPEHFRKWLQKNHKTKTELWVGYYKVGTGKVNMTWSQSVDEALCFGWIDGVRNSIDEESYCSRFTPRRPASNWSEINIKKVKALIKEGRMHPAGLEVYRKRKSKLFFSVFIHNSHPLLRANFPG